MHQVALRGHAGVGAGHRGAHAVNVPRVLRHFFLHDVPQILVVFLQSRNLVLERLFVAGGNNKERGRANELIEDADRRTRDDERLPRTRTFF